jgi:phenylacetate-CoA ligase
VESPGSVHITENEFISEVIDPATRSAVAEGELGELVLTNLGRTACPLIRYRTGDQVRMKRGRCACGRWFARLEGGILGRTDDMVIVRGNNVFPSTIEGILRGVEGVAEFRIEIDRRAALAELKLSIEPVPGGDEDSLGARVTDAFRDSLNFRPQVEVVAPGSLPRFELKAKRVVESRQ